MCHLLDLMFYIHTVYRTLIGTGTVIDRVVFEQIILDQLDNGR